MFRRTFTGSLVAASLTAGALMTIPSASAAPTWVHQENVSGVDLLPQDADVAMSENGSAVATWVREALGTDIVYASYATGGEWTTPDPLTYTSDNVASPAAAINDQGQAVVTWLEEDLSGEMRVAASRHLGGGVFDGRMLISNANDLDATAPLSVGIDGAGTVYAARRDTDGGQINRVRVSSWTKAGAAATQTLSDDTSFAPALAVSEAGRTVVSWYNAGNGESTIDVRSKAAGSNSWAAAQATGLAGAYQVDSDVSIGENGYATVAFARQDQELNYRAWVSKVLPDGLVAGATIASPEDQSAANVSVDQNDAGYTLLAWNAEVNGTDRVRFAARAQGGSFAGAFVGGELSKPAHPDTAVSDSGLIALGYVDAGVQHASYRLTPLQLMTSVDGAGGFVDNETAIAVDNQGNAMLSGIVKLPDPTQGFVSASVLDTAGASTALTSPAANTIGAKAGVAWTATDRFSGVGTANVRVRSAAWNGGFGGYAFAALNTAAKSISFTGAPGRTYCFSAQTKDAVSNLGHWSGERCTTTPVDDRTLSMAKGFKRAKGGAHYQGTYSVATKKGATLKLKNLKGSRIAIVVGKSAKGGKIQVLLGKKILGTYSLKGSGTKKIVAAKSLGGLKAGTLTIKVVSKTGKVVKIDGVIVAK